METQKYIGAERREGTHGVRFDNTINLGHILTFLGFLVTIMVTWSTLDKRVVVLGKAARLRLSWTARRICGLPKNSARYATRWAKSSAAWTG